MATILDTTEPELYSVIDKLFLQNWTSEHAVPYVTRGYLDLDARSPDSIGYDAVDAILYFQNLPDSMPYCSFYYCSQVVLWEIPKHRFALRLSVASCSALIAYIPVDSALSLRVYEFGNYLYALYNVINAALIAMRAGSKEDSFARTVSTAASDFSKYLCGSLDKTDYEVHVLPVDMLQRGLKSACITKTEFEKQRRQSVRDVLHLTDSIVNDRQQEREHLHG